MPFKITTKNSWRFLPNNTCIHICICICICVSYHARREAPILVDQIDEGERDCEEAEEEVGQGQVGDEDVPSGGSHLNIYQHLNSRLKLS